MTTIHGSGPDWTIHRNASRSFQGPDGEIFRGLVLTLAASLQKQTRPPGRGCYLCQLRSQRALRKAFVRGEEDPMLIWLREADASGEAERVIRTYDTDEEFLVLVQAPDHGFIAQVPLHQVIYADGKPVQPVRSTVGVDSDSLVSNIFKVCAWCHKGSTKLFRCQRCKCVVYCGKDCQKAHWSEHKKTCN